MEAAPLQSPLHQWHLDSGAKLADFGGWDMPIEYPKFIVNGEAGGVIAEHMAVREKVGIFDVSHLGKIEIKGEGALDFLNGILTNDLNKISDGSAQYNLICNDAGGTIDDLIVYRRSPSDLFLIPNAANCAAVYEAILSVENPKIAITNEHTLHGVLALQGPKATQVLARLGIDTAFDYMQFEERVIPNHEALGSVIICRTGYTGEFGFELVPSWESTPAVWQLLLDAMKEFGGRVCGLGSRDTLRTEMGYPLHGHELSPNISPLEANAGWAVALKKPTFHGQASLKALKANGLPRILRGLTSSDRGIPRPGMDVLNRAGAIIGIVTSGTFSPSLKTGIALALIDPSVEIGENLTIDVRGRSSAVVVTKPPFVESHVR